MQLLHCYQYTILFDWSITRRHSRTIRRGRFHYTRMCVSCCRRVGNNHTKMTYRHPTVTVTCEIQRTPLGRAQISAAGRTPNTVLGERHIVTMGSDSAASAPESKNDVMDRRRPKNLKNLRVKPWHKYTASPPETFTSMVETVMFVDMKVPKVGRAGWDQRTCDSP
jgi:hypothetical protein